MINLIGPEKRRQYLAARRNTIWRRYAFILIGVLLAMTLVLAGALWLILTQIGEHKQHVQDNEAKRDAAYNTTKLEAEAFRKNLTTAKSIIDGEISYSGLLIDLARTIPSGSVMSTIALNEGSFDIDQSITFKSKKNEDVLKLKTALENSDLFTNVSILNTSENITNGTQSAYPITVTISAKLKKPTVTTETEQTP